LLNSEKIAALLQTQQFGRELICLDSVDSTNEYLKTHAADCGHGCAVAADEQTGGKGRLGRSWASPKGMSLLMSVLLKRQQAEQAVLTLACGLAVARALNSLCGGGFAIKWPNDIVGGGKKICGILCEAKITGALTFTVCGIGINLTQGQSYFDERNLPNGGSVKMLTGAAPSREETAAAVLYELERIYNQYLAAGIVAAEGTISAAGTGAFLQEYCKLCVTIGSEVRTMAENQPVTGIAMTVNPDGSLVIHTQRGDITVYAGDVSVRGISDYI
jgi:BirA family biotin operon repressor/biotin-[acetyl-CoA-carboxylase] ligase